MLIIVPPIFDIAITTLRTPVREIVAAKLLEKNILAILTLKPWRILVLQDFWNGASQLRLNPSHEFPCTEWLPHIVIRTEN